VTVPAAQASASSSDLTVKGYQAVLGVDGDVAAPGIAIATSGAPLAGENAFLAESEIVSGAQTYGPALSGDKLLVVTVEA
jgi:hypothetical protein